jgi:hypothetical protein
MICKRRRVSIASHRARRVITTDDDYRGAPTMTAGSAAASITATSMRPCKRRARQRHDGSGRSQHVSDPQRGAGGCRLEAAHSVPPEIRTCDRRPRQANAVLQTVPDKFGLPLWLLRGRHRVIASSPRASSPRRGQATGRSAHRERQATGARPQAGPTARRERRATGQRASRASASGSHAPRSAGPAAGNPAQGTLYGHHFPFCFLAQSVT